MTVTRWLVGVLWATLFTADAAHGAENYYAFNLTKDSMSAVNFDTVKMGLNNLRYVTFTLVLAVPLSLTQGGYAQIFEEDHEVDCTSNTSKQLVLRTYGIDGKQLTLNAGNHQIQHIEPGTYFGEEESLVCTGTPPPGEKPTTLKALMHRYFEMLEQGPAILHK